MTLTGASLYITWRSAAAAVATAAAVFRVITLGWIGLLHPGEPLT